MQEDLRRVRGATAPPSAPPSPSLPEDNCGKDKACKIKIKKCEKTPLKFMKKCEKQCENYRRTAQEEEEAVPEDLCCKSCGLPHPRL